MSGTISPRGNAVEDLARRYGPGASRRRNAAAVVGELWSGGDSTRADLAAATGLTKASVIALVGDLIEWGLVAECEVTHTGQSGRPSRPLTLTGSWVRGIGVHVTGDAVHGALVDLGGGIAAEATAPIGSGGPAPDADQHQLEPAADGAAIHATSSTIVEVVGALLDAFAADPALQGGGVLTGVRVALPSPGGDGAEMAAGLVVAVEAALAERGHDGPVVLERTGDVVAIAELRARALDPSTSVVVVDGGAAVTAGILLDGRPTRGASRRVGEVGHVVVDPGGGRCRCGGRGCWETVIGVDAVLRETAPDLAGNPRSVRSPAAVDAVVDRALTGDLVALEGLDRLGHWLGVGLATLVAVLDPDLIVLDGYLARLAPWTLDLARGVVEAHAGPGGGRVVEVGVSALGPSAPARSAAGLAVERAVDDPLALVLAAATAPG